MVDKEQVSIDKLEELFLKYRTITREREGFLKKVIRIQSDTISIQAETIDKLHSREVF